MKQKLFIEAIHIAGAAAAAAVASLHENAQTPESMAKIAGSVFASVFKAIEEAGKDGHGAPDEIDSEDDPDEAR